jgi:YidC/Oxa1 family membrane protein insertase
MLASITGQVGHPFYLAFAWLLAAFFAVIPNYAIAIALLTLVVMIVVLPVTLRATRAMMKMQLLAPDIKTLQAKYKVQPAMSAPERRELRQRQHEEMMAVYNENNVSPTGGCLPMLLQFPIFIILYGTIRGLIHQVVVKGALRPAPLYIGHGTRIYKAIGAAHGQLASFGVNLANSMRTSGLPWGSRVPIIAMIVVAVALQYVQMKQLSGRNRAAAEVSPQMQQIQRFWPLIFAVIYISIPAGVNVYFIISSLFRIVQQELIYRRDPQVHASLASLRAQTGPG